MSSFDINRTVRVQVTPKQGKTLATNNLAAILADPKGARCYHCLGTPKITPESRTFEGLTVFCPLCFVDAVVPASQIPQPVNKSLKLWNKYWFSTEAYNSDEEEFVEEFDEEEDNVESENGTKVSDTFQYNIDDFPLVA